MTELPKVHIEFNYSEHDEPTFLATISFPIVKNREEINRILDNFKYEVIKQIMSFFN